MACSVNAYVDATASPLRVEVEATCPLVSQAGDLLEPRGSVLRLSYTLPGGLRSWLPSTPCRPSLLPAPRERYTVVDASIVIDSRPGIDIYGLPERRHAVIAYTARTLLEGRGYLQLAEAAEPLSEAAAVPLGVAPGETGYPLLHPHPLVGEAQLCEARLGPGLRAWGECSNQPSMAPWLRRLASRGCHCRAYAAAAARSSLDPAVLVDTGEPILLRRQGEGVIVHARIGGLVLELRRTRAGGEWESVALRLRPGVSKIPGAWEEAALLCNGCWERIP